MVGSMDDSGALVLLGELGMSGLQRGPRFVQELLESCCRGGQEIKNLGVRLAGLGLIWLGRWYEAWGDCGGGLREGRWTVGFVVI